MNQEIHVPGESLPVETNPAGGQQAAPSSVPATTAPAPQPAAPPTNVSAREPRDYIEARDFRALPQKHLALKEDGSFDAEATLWRLERQRVELEKRFGAVDMRPASADAYEFKLPEQFKGAESMFEPDQVKGFQAKAFDAGLTQSQYEWVLGQYAEVAPALVNGAKQLDVNNAVAALQREWPVEADFQLNVGRANEAIRAYGGAATDAIFTRLGNDPDFVRMMAKIGAEIGSDRAPVNAGMAAGGDVRSLERSEAYSNPKHPDHERVSSQVRDFYQRNAGHEAR